MVRTRVTKANKAIVKYVTKAFGGDFEVTEVVHDDLPLAIDVLSCADRPDPGTTSYSTLGLSDHRMLDRGKEYPTRLELLGLIRSKHDRLGLILGSAAFRIMRTRELVHPGCVFEGYVKEHYPRTGLPHLYFTDPFPWGNRLRTLDCGTKRVSFLLAIPISASELEFLVKKGDEAFDTLMERKNADFTNLNRKPVV